ncbi:MAG: membrane protein insertase YidC [Bdellovibrionales bacterium]|nr:membrane protein insertase YidC [Bdellovibrionales bacterium]
MTPPRTAEDSRRLLLAVFLSVFFILLYGELVVGPSSPPATSKTKASAPGSQNKNETVEPQAIVAPDSPASEAVTTIPHQASKVVTREAVLNAESLSVTSSVAQAKVSLLGGRLTSFQLREHFQSLENKKLVELVVTEKELFPLGIRSGSVSDVNVLYRLAAATEGSEQEQGNYVVPAEGNLVLRLEGQLADGRTITKILTFYPDNYLFDVRAEVSAASVDNKPIALEWVEFEDPNVKQTNYNPKNLTVLTQDNKIERLVLNDLKDESQNFKASWLGIGDNYFLSALISETSGFNGAAELIGDRASFVLTGEQTSGSFKVYLGPKMEPDLLKAGYDLTKSIDLGWFGFIGQPILLSIRFLYVLLGNYGLAIVLFTILLKAALLPLTKTSFKSMKAMQDLQPEMAALRERIKDQAQLQQEIMALYKRRGVNPMGGCLPMLLQIPVFLGMYNALRSSIDLRHTPFALWINDLAAPEQLDVFGIHVPVMIILMGISMFLQQALTPSAADPAQKKVMLMMPVIFTIMFIVFPFPAGLVLYWLTNNLISIIQQWTLRSDSNISSMQATAIGGVGIFCFAWIVTLI